MELGLFEHQAPYERLINLLHGTDRPATSCRGHLSRNSAKTSFSFPMSSLEAGSSV
jgi:hypothetical protein